MNELELMEALTGIRSCYVVESAPKQYHRTWLPKLAAAVAALVLLAAFFCTPPGAAAANYLRRQAANLVELLFPPKELATTPEGAQEKSLCHPRGREPSETRPGFALYVDTERYQLVWEQDICCVRPLTYDPESPLNCELIICEVPEIPPETLAQQIYHGALGQWERVSPVWRCPQPTGYSLDLSAGLQWNAQQEGHYFISNRCGGSFHIILRYFLEAAEGHATRMNAMLRTFSVIAPQESTCYADPDQALLLAVRQELELTTRQSGELLTRLQTDPDLTQLERTRLQQQRQQLWLDALDVVWRGLESTLPAQSLQSLTWDQLDWCAGKAASLQQELWNGGDGMSSVVSDTDRLEERTRVLLLYLDGTLPVAIRQGAVPDPRPAAEAAAHEALPGAGIHAVKGLDRILSDIARNGCLTASIEFRETPEADSFTYLTVTLLWQDGKWQAASDVLEK